MPNDNAGAKWVQQKGLVQINGHITPELHTFLIDLSSGIEMPVSDILSRCIQALKDDALRAKVLGMDRKVQGVKESA